MLNHFVTLMKFIKVDQWVSSSQDCFLTEPIPISMIEDSLDIHCLVMLRDVKPQQLCHGDGQPHGVALLCLHYVRYRANQILLDK